MKRIFIVIILMAMLCGCKEIQYVPVESVRTEYVRSTDTIRQYDSIYVERIDNADTIYINQFKYKYLYKTKIDTVRICDSIPVPVPIETEKIVEVVPKAYRWSMGICISLLTALLIAFIYNVRKK